MITPPPNPNAATARADMMQHNATIKPVEEHHGETVIAEWHNDGDRTFTIADVTRWFKIAMPLSEAARREQDA